SVRGAVDLDHVERDAVRDLAAARALVAGIRTLLLARGAALAVERLGHDARAGGLAHAARAGEEVGVSDAAALEGAREHRAHVLLADHVGEDLRAILEGQWAMRHPAPRRGRARRTSGTP